MYLSYDEYLNMGGALSETSFNSVSFEAETLINWHSFNRLKTETIIPEAVKHCVLKLIPLIQLRDSSLTPGAKADKMLDASIISQSNDGVSTTYNAISSAELFKTCQTEILNTIRMYLDDVYTADGKKLLYRGVC